MTPSLDAPAAPGRVRASPRLLLASTGGGLVLVLTFMRSSHLPGYALMALVACGAQLGSKLVVVGGKEPLEPALLALTVGMLVRSRGAVRPACEAGLRDAERALVASVVLMGAELNFAGLIERGGAVIAVIVASLLAGMAAVHALGALFRLPRALTLLLAVGTTICGGAAIALVAPIVRAPQAETADAIRTISCFSLIAVLLYPLAAHHLRVSDVAFGVFAGTAIPSLPQVAGAGFIYSELAGHTAAAVKLVRSGFIAPVVLVLAHGSGVLGSWARPPAASEASRQRGGAARAPFQGWIFPWFLFGLGALAGACSLGLLDGSVAAWMRLAGEQLMVVGMAGVGLNTNLGSLCHFERSGALCRFERSGALRSRGARLAPLLVGLLGSMVVALVSSSMIRALLGAAD